MKTTLAFGSSLAAKTLVVFSLLGLGTTARPDGIEKATAEAPPNAQAVAGSYYKGTGLAYNLNLTLQPSGEYTAAWDSCLYKPGKAAGQWRLSDKRITFTPPMEGEMMRGSIETVEILKLRGEWVLLPIDNQSLKLYDRDGVTPFSCFQKVDLAGHWSFANGVMGEFHTVELRKERTFSWVLRDEPLHAEDTYHGTWQVRDGAVHLSFVSGQTKSGDPLKPRQRTLVLSVGNDALTGDAGLKLERVKPKPAA